MSWLDDIGSFISSNITTPLQSNKSWLNPLLGGALGAYQISNKNDERQSTLDWMTQQEQKNYDTAKQNYQAYQDYLGQYNNWAAGAAKARAAAAAAHAKAARQTEANRQKAEKKALKNLNASYETAKGYYQPFYNAATAVLPQVQKTYGTALDTMGMLAQYLTKADQMKKLAMPGNVWDQSVPLPSYMGK